MLAIMMLIIAVLRRTGLFEFVAIWAAKKARSRPFPIMIVTGVVSAGLDNVTTVLLVAPVTLLVAERLGVPSGAVPDRRGPRVGDVAART
jgi:Na+/H+ antiporter NhaD/arsenite permease-like protein